MKIYLVGGAVRDQLLGREVKERDYVVVGATVPEMLKLGYRQVGKDFPVFLHPVTQEEYALARTERKVGRGYTGFTFDASPAVTLEEDLIRRDLTINAMAQAPDGALIDPYHGQDDLTRRLLRHVSDAFIEDPVRILRVGRFAARFAGLGFKVAPETNALMQTMVQSGEVDALVAERVWKELERALGEDHPEQFFRVLADCNALSVLFPQIKINGQGVAALIRAVSLTTDAQVRFAALLHDLSVEEVQALCARYRVPIDYRDLAVLIAKHHAQYPHLQTLDAEKITDLLQLLDAYRRVPRFEKFLLACQAIYSQTDAADYLRVCFAAARAVDVRTFAAGLKGPEIAERLRSERIQRIKNLKKDH